MLRKLLIIGGVVFLTAKIAGAATGADFINNWLVLGTFDNDAKNTGFQRAWIDEVKAAPKEGSGALGKKWMYFDDRLFSRNYDDYQDLLSYYKIKRNESVTAKVVYAHTYVYSPEEIKAIMVLGADTFSQVWLNGAPVLKSEAGQWKRDSVKAEVTLKQGWNGILVKVANVENTRLGFYLGFTNRRDQPLKNLVVSVNGGNGPLAVATSGMPDAATGTMPTGWREWPYITARPDPALIYPKGAEQDEVKWILNSFLKPGSSGGFVQTDMNTLRSTAFSFQAQGGTPPYSWSVTGGDLPPGLTLTQDGRIEGDISANAELKTYSFVARVKDAAGTVAKKDLSIKVLERPNKWFEEARLTCLIHAPEYNTDSQIEEMAVMAKKQGYQVVMPISYNNGEMAFRWPSPWAPKGTRDTAGKFKEAFEKQGITFGMYMGNLNLEVRPGSPFKNKEQHLMVEEAINRFHPKAFWFDWPTWSGEALDALYSMIRTLDPNIVIVLNGQTNASNGDWDIISFEAWGAWGYNTWAYFPVDIPWPKKGAPESWRRMSIPYDVPPAKDLKTDAEWKAVREMAGPRGPATDPVNGYEKEWKEYYRAHIAMIAEGFIANMDFSITSDPRKPERKGKMLDSLADAPYYPYRVKMVDWASPKGLPALYPSFTQVNPGPLESADWGYNLINTTRDAVYLHFQKNPRGKKGLPEESTLTVWPLNQKVKSVTWMNENKPLKFSQQLTASNKFLTIDLEGVTQDEIDTIVKIELEAPLPLEIPKLQQIPAGNLASFKKSSMFGLDGKTHLIPSGGNLAKYGVDGNPATYAVGGGSWAWIYEVDLERVYPVKKVALLSNPHGFATEYEVLLSDDRQSWEKVATVKDMNVSTRIESDFPATDARYVRLKAVTPNAPNQVGGQMSVAELEVYE